jgi:hypothetical protein
MDDINIIEHKEVAEGLPRYSFISKFRGQACYIITRCREEKVFSKYELGYIHIYSKKKLDLFKKIIEESFKVKMECIPLEKEKVSFYKQGHLLCFMHKPSDCTYVVDKDFEELILHQFKGSLPITKNYKIFRLQKEMKEDILNLGIII